jgi:hypothetical protein
MAPARLRAPAPVRVVFDGQSFLNWPAAPDNVPSVLMHGNGVPWHNVAVDGQGWGVLATTQAARLFPQARPSPLLDVLVMVGGWSDIVYDGETGEATHAFAVAYADAARAAGFDQVICATIPASGPNILGLGIPTSTDYERIDAYNALVMADADGDFDAVVDLAVAPLDDATNATYFLGDKLHFRAAGAAAAAELIRPVLEPFLTPPSGPPVGASCVAQWWAEDIVADGAVTTWEDRVGAHDLTQATSGFRPTAAGSGAARAVTFDGTNDRLSWDGDISSSSSGCIVAVVSYATARAGSSSHALASASHPSNYQSFRFGAYDWQQNIEENTGNTGGSGYEYVRTTSAVLSANTLTAVEVSSSGSAYTFRTNNTTSALTVGAGSNNGNWFGSTTTTQFTVGAWLRPATTGYLNGKVAFLAVYDAPLSSGDRADLYGWINDHYGI